MSAPEIQYDFIIAGAGSAGCVLAGRLSEDPAIRVLLLEAGPPDFHPDIATPVRFPALFGSEVDWRFATVPQAALGGRKVYHPRGKTLGGSSSINAQIYLRGHPADFDAWEAGGAEGWGYESVLPYFRRAERNATRANARLHGRRGPLHVSDPRSPNPISRAFLAAAAEAGLPRIADFNAEDLEGAGLVQLTQRRGRRWSAADAYLRPALSRPNLHVETGARVTRVILDGRRATGLEYRSGDGGEQIRHGGEVLLSAGAFQSPQLLLLSGIGDPEALETAGVRPAIELPGVGRNLQDHPMVGLVHGCRRPASLLNAGTWPNRMRYRLLRRGPRASNIAEALAFARSSPTLSLPDLELIFSPVHYDIRRPADRHAFSIGVVALQPRSVGSVTLASADPLTLPRIDPAYLSDPAGEDLRTLVAGLRLALRIVGSPALDDHRGPCLAPKAGLGPDEEFHRFVREAVETVYHPVGSCRIGRDALAVVDPELKVHGVDGLRVVDASVMPSIVRGHPNAATIMIAEKASDQILGRLPPPDPLAPLAPPE